MYLALLPDLADKVLEGLTGNSFYDSVTSFFTGIWAFITGLAESISTFSSLLFDSVGNLGALFAYMPFFVGSFALTFITIRFVKTILGR